MGEGGEAKKQLGKIMLQQRLVTADELNELLEDQRREPGRRLASTATRRGRVKMHDALRVLGEQHGLPPVDLTESVVSLSLLNLIPVEMAQEHVVFPLRVDGETLELAMASPHDANVLEEIAFVTGKTIAPRVALEHVLRQGIEYAYAAQERGEEFYIGAHVPDEQLAPLGITTHVRAPEPIPEGVVSNSDRPGESDAAHDDPELFPPQPPARTVSDAPPLDPAFAEHPSPSQPPAAPSPSPNARVLVADHEPQTRALLRDAMSQLGLQVLETEGGVATLERVREALPKVLVLDADLPQVHGFDICRRLKDTQRFGTLPIVMVGKTLSGWRVAEDLREAYGVRHVFAKPLDVAAVVRVVRLLLEGRDLPQEPPPLSQKAEACWVDAMAAFERGDLDAAIGQLETGVFDEPDTFELSYHLGLLYGRRDELFHAIGSLERAVSLQPRNFSALKNLAVVYQRAGFRHKARDAWERALGVAPDETTRISIRDHLISLL